MPDVPAFKPPQISEANERDPLDAELCAIQRLCLTSWSEHEIIERIEAVRASRHVQQIRLGVTDEKWG